MKISTDAVLLGALAKADSPQNILDIGTGTGVISLMLAQRFPDSLITAIEIDPDAAGQAEENFSDSPFSERLRIIQGKFQDYCEDRHFDLIVSNPPYFPDHLKPKDSKRNQALHTDALSFEEVIEQAARLLKRNGEIWIILPPRQMGDFSALALKRGLFPIHRILVRDRPFKPIIREIVGFSQKSGALEPIEIFLKNENGAFSEAYSILISGFLLGY